MRCAFLRGRSGYQITAFSRPASACTGGHLPAALLPLLTKKTEQKTEKKKEYSIALEQLLVLQYCSAVLEDSTYLLCHRFYRLVGPSLDRIDPGDQANRTDPPIELALTKFGLGRTELKFFACDGGGRFTSSRQ